MTFQQLTRGDVGPAVGELHRRLHELKFLDLGASDAFEDQTADAVRAFQASRGLDETGECDPHTWRAILEAEHQFGSRTLYLTKPMLRGDDVASLQLRLGSLGFNAGRVDGIFGPNTQNALREFQRNVSIIVDGVFARDTFDQLVRLGSKSSSLSVAGLRERESLRTRTTELAGLSVSICHTGSDTGLSGALGAELQLADAVVTVTSDPDWSVLAQQTNAFGADVCIAIQITERPGLDIAYFGTDGSHSVAGQALAETLLRQLPHPPGWGPGVAHGKRLPILRETRCPTIRVKLGPADEVLETQSLLIAAVSRSLNSWTAELSL